MTSKTTGTAATQADAPQTLHDLITDYVWHNDQRDINGVMHLFEPEAVLESAKTGTSVHGHEAIAALLTRAWAQVPPGDRRRHLVSGARALSSTGDCTPFRATFSLVGTAQSGAPAIYVTGCYQGVARRSDAGLRFRHLTVVMD